VIVYHYDFVRRVGLLQQVIDGSADEVPPVIGGDDYGDGVGKIQFDLLLVVFQNYSC
jgi:hypothetical protein